MAPSQSDSLAGILFCLSAGILWGIMPVYIGFVDGDDPYEIIAQRSLWSAVSLFVVCWVGGQLKKIWDLLNNRKNLCNLLVTTFFLSLNWGIYVFAVQSEQVVSAALGYFIYPLCTVILGILLLGERLNGGARFAVGFVCLGVFVKAMTATSIPWISLALAGSFSVYTVLRKKIDFDPLEGLFIETLLLTPIAIGFLIWLKINGQTPFFGGGILNLLLAFGFGLITVLPLLLFLKGGRVLNVTMASLIFYSNPTVQLLLGVFVFAEQFTLIDLIPFGLIWIGILTYFITQNRVALPSEAKH